MRRNGFLFIVMLLMVFGAILLERLLNVPPDNENFLGAWRWIGATYADGSPAKIFGERPVGYIVYTPAGIMSMQVMRQSGSKLGDYLAYSGHFDIDMKDKIVTDHAETSLDPEMVGKTLARSYRFEGDRLYLKSMDSEEEITFIWERVK